MNKQAPQTKATDAAAKLISLSGDFAARLYYNDGANTVYLGIDGTVTATGATKGYPLAPGKEFYDPSKNSTYGVCAAGQASSIIVFAVSL
ncbi:MAG TPA: hypothetical protein VNI84_14245 [Pyrinomonadaceae bacterium]|nr:hypothetical protein [Pyrinomonadaceae bacterium]